MFLELLIGTSVSHHYLLSLLSRLVVAEVKSLSNKTLSFEKRRNSKRSRVWTEKTGSPMPGSRELIPVGKGCVRVIIRSSVKPELIYDAKGAVRKDRL